MTLRSKGHQRSAQAITLPVGLTLAPITRVSREAKENFMAPPILVELIRKIAAGTGLRSARRAHQCEPDRVIVALVRAVFHIGENRGSVCAAFVRQVDPVMRRDLE